MIILIYQLIYDHVSILLDQLVNDYMTEQKLQQQFCFAVCSSYKMTKLKLFEVSL